MHTRRLASSLAGRGIMVAAALLAATGCDPSVTLSFRNGCGFPIRVGGKVLQPDERDEFTTVGDRPDRVQFVVSMPNGDGETRFPGPDTTFAIDGDRCPVLLDEREQVAARVTDFITAFDKADRALAVRALCEPPDNFVRLSQRYAAWVVDHGRVALDQTSVGTLSATGTIDVVLRADEVYAVRAVMATDEFGELCISALTDITDGPLSDPPIWPPF